VAGKHGGGAWKVAYADFVTAMMAFFLVMWICGQDQKVRRSVSDYFSDPLGSTGPVSSKKPSRTGAAFESVNSGSIPLEEQVAMGQGRRSYSKKQTNSKATKQVSDWLHHDPKVSAYWKKQAQDQRESAQWSKSVKESGAPVEKVAARMLSVQLQDELNRDVPSTASGVYRDLLQEILSEVNWDEIAEDLVDR
jgi:chemotaxis protein MotB